MKIEIPKIIKNYVNKTNDKEYYNLLKSKNYYVSNWFNIKIDKRLTIIAKNNKTKHHLIPTWYEIIPDLTLKWTLKWLKNNNIFPDGFRIKDRTLILNTSYYIFLTEQEHINLHLYLDWEKNKIIKKIIRKINKENLLLLNGENKEEIIKVLLSYYNKFIFKIDNKYEKYYIDRNEYQKNLLKEKKYIYIGLEKSFHSQRTQKKYTNIAINLRKKIDERILEIEKQEINIWNIDQYMLELIKIIPKNIKLNYLWKPISSIKKFYIRHNNNIIKNIDESLTKYNIWQMNLKDNSMFISSNILKIDKYKWYIDKIFILWLSKNIWNISVIIDKNNKIISWIPLVAFFYYNKINDINFNYIQLI